MKHLGMTWVNTFLRKTKALVAHENLHNVCGALSIANFFVCP